MAPSLPEKERGQQESWASKGCGNRKVGSLWATVGRKAELTEESRGWTELGKSRGYWETRPGPTVPAVEMGLEAFSLDF